MILLVICTILAFIVLARAIFRKNHERMFRPLPPGPQGLPLLGFAPFIGPYPWLKFTDMFDKYGSVMSFRIGGDLCVVLQDYDAIKAAFLDQDSVFHGRPEKAFVSQYISTGRDGKISGLIAMDGKKYVNTIRVLKQFFKTLVVGENVIGKVICEELDSCFLPSLDLHAGTPYDPNDDLYLTYSNVILRVLIGRKFTSLDEFETRMGQLPLVFAALGEGVLQSNPWLRHLPGRFRKQWSAVQECKEQLRTMFQTALEEYRENRPLPNRTSLISMYLDYLGPQHGEFDAFTSDDDFITTATTLICAGPEGPTIPIGWGLLYLCYHKKVQQMVHGEIDRNIGRNRKIVPEDAAKLPFTVATCMEMNRLGGSSPLGVPRSNYEETEIMGYRIPKRSIVFGNKWCALRDPKHFEDPLKFIPERFLSPDGTALIVPPQYQAAFSMGTRVCPGQEIGELITFLTLSYIMQNHEIEAAPGYPLPSLTKYGSVGVSAKPCPYKILVKAR